MTDQEIKDGNKLIAEFMGYPTKKYWWHHPEPDEIDNALPTSLSEFICAFHSNWNWIMPVVEKLELKYGYVFESCRGRVAVTLLPMNDETPSDLCVYDSRNTKSRIEAMWSAIVHILKEDKELEQKQKEIAKEGISGA